MIDDENLSEKLNFKIIALYHRQVMTSIQYLCQSLLLFDQLEVEHAEPYAQERNPNPLDFPTSLPSAHGSNLILESGHLLVTASIRESIVLLEASKSSTKCDLRMSVSKADKEFSRESTCEASSKEGEYGEQG